MPPKAPEEKIRCPECAMQVQRRNLSRHRQIHLETGEEMNRTGRGFLCRSVTSTAPVRSRSSSRDSQQSTAERYPVTSATTAMDIAVVGVSDAASRPPTGVLMDATRAILHQRNVFTEEQLCTYVAQHYPEIPAACRRYLVVGAVSGAQYAAYQHHLWRDNARVTDPGLRRMASEAASTLSWWTMGFRPNYNVLMNQTSGPTDRRLHGQTEEPPVEAAVADQEDSTFSVDDLQLPVPFSVSNEEFQRALGDISFAMGGESVPVPEVPSAVEPEVAVGAEKTSTVTATIPLLDTPATATASSVATSTVGIPDATSCHDDVTSATLLYSPEDTGKVTYNPTPIVLLQRAETLKRQCLKRKMAGPETDPKTAKTAETSTRADDELELHAPADIDMTPEATKEAQSGKPEHKNPSSISTQKIASTVVRKVTDTINDRGKKFDTQQPSTSKDRHRQSPVNRRERSPVQRREISPVGRREKSPVDNRVGLYRLSAEEYALIEKKRHERSSEHRSTYRRK